MASYKLIYFNFRGRAEVARYLFALADQKYEDYRFPFDTEMVEWKAIKPTTPLGQVPVLQVTENSVVTQIGQSMAIVRYLARKFGFAGKSEIEQALVEMWGEQIKDFGNEMIPIFFFEQDAEKRSILIEKANKETIPKNLALFEAQLAKNKSGYLVGDGLTWGDLMLHNIFDWVAYGKKCIDESVLEQYPHIKKHINAINANPKIAKWIETRPVTEK